MTADGGGKTREEETELEGPIFPDLLVYMLWILSTEFAVNSMWISTLLQFFVTLGYEGRAVDLQQEKNYIHNRSACGVCS